MPSRFTIQDMQFFAKQMGGKCLSREYKGIDIPIAWMCTHGHTFDMSYHIIQQGGWCIQCTRGREQHQLLEDLQEIAKAKGGKCLSKKYESKTTRMQWECSEGHQWTATPSRIKYAGYWCAMCAKNELNKKRLVVYQDIAQARGGKCVSKFYVSQHTKLKWQCKEGHKWVAFPNEVRSGSWCMKCFRQSRKLTIDKMHQAAKEKGGKCLSQKYIDSHTQLKWQCARKHTWMAKPNSVINSNTWCLICANVDRVEKRKLPIAGIKKLAKQKGGILISKTYHNSHTPMKWQCKHGHNWMASVGNIKNNHWCPFCAHTRTRIKPRT